MKKVLIVEDEPAYVRLLSDKLRRRYEVLHAPNGQEGLRLAFQQRPDLIVLDIKMPKMDGMTVLKELRKDKQKVAFGQTVKVILLTNLEATDKIVVKVTRDLPTYYFIKSDVELDYLLEKIHDLLSEPETGKK